MKMTVQTFQVMTNKETGEVKKDKFGNTQMMIKFAESPETAYKAVKDPSTITEGKAMYGEVVEGQFGYRFQADPYGDAPASTPSQPVQLPNNLTQTGIINETELLKLAKDNNKMLKQLLATLTGSSDVEPVEQSEVPIEAYGDLSEPDFGDM